MRVRAAKASWARMGRFWFWSLASRRGKLLVYRALVHNTLLSGLECLVLEKQKYAQLGSLVLRHGRKLMQGQACFKQQLADGSTRYVACKSKDVWRWLRLCPSELELQVRRLSWYQQLARDIERHQCVLLALLGKLGCEVHDTIDAAGRVLPNANPWAKQFAADMQLLCNIDDGQTLLAAMGDQYALALTEYAEEFVSIDVTALRGTFDPVCVPPPGWHDPEPPPNDERVDQVALERPFVCDRLCQDGSPCLQAYPTAQALAVRKSSTKGGTHDNLSDMAVVSITNACGWCKRIFSSTQSARNHIRRTLKEGRCSGSGSRVYFKILQPSSLRCRACEQPFPDVHQLLEHATCHVRLPGPAEQ